MTGRRDWTLIISGGGSGGHLYPALAVLEELRFSREPPQRAVCLHSGRAIDQRILSAFEVEAITLTPLASERNRRAGRSVTRATAWKTAFREVRRASRCVVLGAGGASSLPGVIAARLLRRPTVLLEPNIVPGRATSLLHRLGGVTGVAYAETQQALGRRCVVTGVPIRAEMAALATQPRSPSRAGVIILGGSQGTHALNADVVEAVQRSGLLKTTLAGQSIWHQTGVRDRALIASRWRECRVAARVEAFFDDLPVCYAAAQWAISRAGAVTLAELACAGLPALLAPFPGAVRDHQMANAHWFATRGAAAILPQPAAVSAWTTAIQQFAGDEALIHNRAAAMRELARPDAALNVANLVLEQLDRSR